MKKRSQKRLMLIGFFVSIVVSTSIAFQNCGGSFPLTSSGLDSEEDFFGYPYKSAPDFYASMNLFRQEEAANNLSEFKFMAAAAPTWGETSIQWEVKIQTEDGNTVCPTQSGTLSPGTSSIEFDCVSLLLAPKIIVQMTLSSSGRTQVFEQSYR